MNLATIDSADELVEARKVIAEARLNEEVLDYTTQTWIGLIKPYLDDDEDWVWVIDIDREIGLPTVYTNWWQGERYEGPEPNNNYRGQPVEGCVEMSLEGTWND